MKIARTLGMVFCGALLLAGPLSGQSATGKWVFAVDLGAAGGGDATFELVQVGALGGLLSPLRIGNGVPKLET